MSDANLVIRNEKEEDYRNVEQLVREAFWNHNQPGCDEHFILQNLRNSSDFVPDLDFVAEKAGQIVGQIAYSRGIIKRRQGGDRKVLSFGPISVLPAFQKRGIGSALITHTVNLARKMGYPAICIYGDPRYYSRFGFRCAEKYEIKTEDDKYAVALQVLELKPRGLTELSGRFVESSALEVDQSEFAQYDATFPFKEKNETDSQREFRLLAGLRY
jgi:putative acetyltransferase